MEMAPENVDDAVAREIFNSETAPQKSESNKLDEEGVQLSIFDD